MLKRGWLILSLSSIFVILFLAGVLAQRENPVVGPITDESIDGEIQANVGESDDSKSDEEVGVKEENKLDEVADQEGDAEIGEEGEVELEVGAGTTPDSFFYFIDEFFDQFGDELNVREEKISEIKVMVEAGNIEDAKKALERYKEYANSVEKEISPEDKVRAEKSANTIRKVIKRLEKEVPEEDRKEFVDNVIEKEKKIQVAAEIAVKVKELCEQLSKLDPNEYARVCRTREDGVPKWHKRLDERLTEEQKQAALKFEKVMRECFRTEGKECKCNELEGINKPFADRCSIVAPLAAKCEDGDDASCEAMDEATEGIEELLPDYLQEVLGVLNERLKEDQFEFHMPPECRKEGAKSPKECMLIMFREHAPEECAEALRDGKISFTNEKEAREQCEGIMFEANAPEECIEAGLKDHRECGTFMFKQNAAQECIDAGLTGESPKDGRECEKIMRAKGGEGKGRGPPGFAPAFGFRCKGIQDTQERLKCFDEALQGVEGGFEGRGDFEGKFEGEEKGQGPHGGSGWPQPCQEAQAFTRESCEKTMREWGEKQRNQDEDRFRREREERERDFRPPEGQQPQCGPGQSLKCDNNGCRCEGEPQQQPVTEQSQPPITSEQQQPAQTSPPTTESGGSGSGTSESGTSGRESGSTGGTSGSTGSVIGVDNDFLDYYWR